MAENTKNELTNAIRDAMFDLRAELIKQGKFKSADIPVLTRNIMPNIVKMAMASGDPVKFLGSSGIVKEIGEISSSLLKSFYDDNNEAARPGYVRWPIGHVLDIIHKILPEIVSGMAESGRPSPFCIHCKLAESIMIGKEPGALETGAPDDQAGSHEPTDPKG